MDPSIYPCLQWSQSSQPGLHSQREKQQGREKKRLITSNCRRHSCNRIKGNTTNPNSTRLALEFQSFLRKQGILWQPTAPYTAAQDPAERPGAFSPGHYIPKYSTLSLRSSNLSRPVGFAAVSSSRSISSFRMSTCFFSSRHKGN